MLRVRRICIEVLSAYEVHTVGNAGHREYWIPAADVAKFNTNLVGQIEVVAEYHG